MSLGFTARETIPIVFFGFAICSVVVTLTGKMGATYNVPFPVIVRSTFGMYGSYVAICIRAFVAAMWTAILCVQAGAFLQCCLEAIWPSFINFPNHLPEDAGITSAGLLCFSLYWCVQTILALMPISKLRVLFWVKGIIVPPTFLALFLWAVVVTHGGGELVTGKMKLTSSYMNTAYSALTGLNDFGRFSKNRLAGYHQFFALPVIGTLGALTPIFVTSAHSHIWGEFEWYMPAVIGKFDSRAAKFFTGFSFMLATIGNQIAAGTYPFSNDICGICPKYINIFRATLLISIFCFVSTPWNIIKNAAGLLAFLSGYSCLMGPLAGTMVCDYYIIKKRKLDVHELYRDHGIYWYWHGINWRAFVAFTGGFAALLPGFAKSIKNSLDVGGAWKIYAFAWIFGFFTSLLLYFVICTYISPPVEALVEAAVYPPQKGDIESVVPEDTTVKQMRADVKELSDEPVDNDIQAPSHSADNIAITPISNIVQTPRDYAKLEGSSLLKETLGLQNHRHSCYIGASDEFEPVYLGLVPFQKDEHELPQGTLRRVSSHETFLLRPDNISQNYDEEPSDLDAIQRTVEPNGPALVALYFRIVHPSFPILHKLVFLEKYSRSYREFSPPLLAAVYMLALQWWSYDQALAQLKKPDTTTLQKLASKSLDDVMTRPKLSTVQAGLLLSQFLPGDLVPLTARLVAVGQTLGLDRDCTVWRIPDWERGLRKRLAWALYLQDRWVALTHGRSCMIPTAHWSVDTVSDEDFPETVNDENDEEGSAEVEKGKMSFQQFIDLTTILSDILESPFSIDFDPSIHGNGLDSAEKMLQWAKPVQARLKEWYSGLPESLRMDDVKLRKLSSTGASAPYLK
ncbi:MAG: hypothetical protein Q9160_000184 [Pyrenula sp. 1 TL-2023]